MSTIKRAINWPQAIAEVCILPAGVGLALLADSWVDSKRERQEEKEYLMALHRDFQKTRSNLAATVDATRRSNDLTLALLIILRGDKQAISESKLAMSIQSTFRIEVPASVFGTYQDMVNSGDLRLLRNGELRLALAEFVSEWDKYEASIAEGFNQWNQI